MSNARRRTSFQNSLAEDVYTAVCVFMHKSYEILHKIAISGGFDILIII